MEFAGNYNGPLYAPHPDLAERADVWHPDPEKDRKLGESVEELGGQILLLSS